MSVTIDRHPATKKHLAGSKWSADPSSDLAYKHWEVVGAARGDGTVVLKATLDVSVRIYVNWKHLRDRTAWHVGWI